MKRWVPKIHDSILIEMNNSWKLTLRGITEMMGFPAETVQAAMKRIGLVENPASVRLNPSHREYLPPPPKERPNPVTQAEIRLGTRLTRTEDGFRLDGKLANLPEIMKAAGLPWPPV